MSLLIFFNAQASQIVHQPVSSCAVWLQKLTRFITYLRRGTLTPSLAWLHWPGLASNLAVPKSLAKPQNYIWSYLKFSLYKYFWALYFYNDIIVKFYYYFFFKLIFIAHLITLVDFLCLKMIVQFKNKHDNRYCDWFCKILIH